MDNIKDVSQLEKEFTELQDYSSAQFSVIRKLQEKIDKLEAENKHLQTIVNEKAGLIQLGISDIIPGISKEEIICETQIELLKQDALTRPLTKDEVQKFQILSDILGNIKKSKKPENSTEELQDAEVLSIIDGSKQS